MRLVTAVFAVCILWSSSVSAQTEAPASRAKATDKIIIDTDIGNDIDDAFAVGLALHSPEFQILGISSAWGDTHLRARLLSRLLKETGGTPGTRTIPTPWTFFWTKYDYIQVRSRLSPLALKRTWERRLTATRRHSGS